MGKTDQKSAIISSTAIDLPEHRSKIKEACLAMDIFPRMMESLPARDVDAIRASLEMVDKADIYIGVFAWRYGHVPAGHDISITEMELARAVERKIPILIFLIHKNHPLIIDQVESNEKSQAKLAALKEKACKGRGRREFKSPDELSAQVIQALANLALHEWKPGSPVEAIRAEEERLQQLDPRYSVSIAATSDSMDVQIQSIEPVSDLPKIEFLNEEKKQEATKSIKQGEPFRIKATDIKITGSPLHSDIIKSLGDADIIFPGLTFPGYLQFHFGSAVERSCIQVDGEWVIAPNRISFVGQLRDAPLKVHFTRRRGEDGKWEPFVSSFTFDWGAWGGQPLLALGCLNELEVFFAPGDLLVRFYIRGHQEWPAERLTLAGPGVEHATEAIRWIQKCKRVAHRIGANPPFPSEYAFEVIQSNDVRLLIKLIEEGKHEQANEGELFEITADELSDDAQALSDIGSLVHLENRMIEFFGINFPIGPVKYILTQMEHINTRPAGTGRVHMTFKGKKGSVLRVEYKVPAVSPDV